LTNIEAMKLALEALEKIDGAMPFPVGRSAITALRTAIETAEKQEPTGKQSLQVEQEPVAEVKLKTTGGNVGIATVIHEIYSHYREPLRVGDKLYTTPPAAQPAERKAGCTLCGYCAATGERVVKADTRNGLIDNDFEENT